MAERKHVLVRLDPKVHEAMQRWADDELRSLNAQIEFVLRRALQQGGRMKPAPASGGPGGAETSVDTTETAGS